MDSFLQVTAADDAEVKLAAKKTVIISSTRYQQELGTFVAAADDETDLDSRLHLVEDEVRAIVTEACAETGYDDIPGVTASILMTARQHFADKDKADKDDSKKPWENQDEDKDSEDEEKTSRVAASAEGTPVPKMDKRKWTPKSLGEIPKDDADGRNPTVHQDTNEQGKPVNTDEHDLEQIGEKGALKREDVTKSYTDQVGEKGAKHPHINQAKPVTAAIPGVDPNSIDPHQEGQGWLQDIDHPEAHDKLNPEDVKHFIEQHYDGGYNEFLRAIGHEPEGQLPVPPPGSSAPIQGQFSSIQAAGQYAPIVDQDAHKNPVQDVLDQQFNGFVPQDEVDRAISLHNTQ